MDAESLYTKYYDLFTDTEHDEPDAKAMIAFVSHKLGRPVETAIEVGCGTGRHTIHVATMVQSLLAIDPDPCQVQKCREKLGSKAAVYQGTVEDVAFADASPADLIYALGNIFNYLLEPEEALSFLKACRSRLKPDGMIVLEMWNGIAALADPPRDGYRFADAPSGVGVRRRMFCHTLKMDQLSILEYIFQERSTCDGTIVNTETWEFRHRLWTPLEMQMLLHQSGFGDVKYSAPFAPNSPATINNRWIMFYSKPTS